MLNFLKENCQLIHYFGLGFIQLKINKEYRLHFYTPELPAIVPEEDIHNHRYDFTSMILKGSLTQEIFSIDLSQKTHIMEDESCKSDIKCSSEKIPCGIKLLTKQIFCVGSQYSIDHDTFHRVNAKECITLLKRTDYKKEFAKVVRKEGDHVCPFSKKIEEPKLWEIVEKMLT